MSQLYLRNWNPIGTMNDRVDDQVTVAHVKVDENHLDILPR